MANLKDLIVLGVSRFIGNVYGSKFITNGGTSSLFVKGDGTLDSNTYLTTETDPTVPAWAKASTKPSYTANEVGALPDSTLYAGAAVQGGAANKAVSIPFGQVDSTSTATAFTATVDGVTELRDGVCVYLKNDVVNSAEGYTININNLGAKPVYDNHSTVSSTGFGLNDTLLFVYNSSRIEEGCWDYYAGNVGTTNTTGYILRTNSLRLPTTDKFYRYRILFTSLDGTHYIPANTSTSTNATAARTVNQRVIDPFGRIVYYAYTTAVSAEANPVAAYCRDLSTLTLGYSFNRTGAALTLTQWKPVYLKCAPLTTGGAIIDADTPYVQDLPVAEDGKIYIFLGVAYSETAIEMLLNHPVYYYKDGAIRLWTALESRIAALEARIAALEQLV